jgi:hypothetical protein
MGLSPSGGTGQGVHVEAGGVDANRDARTGGAGAANDRRRRQTDERSEEGWWRRRESNPRPETSLRESLQVYPGLKFRRRREGRAEPAAASPIDLAFRPRTEGTRPAHLYDALSNRRGRAAGRAGCLGFS